MKYTQNKVRCVHGKHSIFRLQCFRNSKKKKKNSHLVGFVFCMCSGVAATSERWANLCMYKIRFIHNVTTLYVSNHSHHHMAFISFNTYVHKSTTQKKKKKSPNWMREIHISTIHLCVKYLNLFFFSPFHMCLCMIHQHNITLIV